MLTNLLQIIFIAVVGCFVYEIFIRPYFEKREIARMEKKTLQWVGLIGNNGIVSAESEKKEVLSLLKMYEDTEFDQNQNGLKREIAKLLFLYVNTVFRLITQHGIQITSVDRDDATGTVEEIFTLEKQKHQLENSIKNLIGYVRMTKEREE